ncbi:M28 family metallopeptidase [Anaerovorax odorimutans]|nr:M28 family metallopeptidase [Anaerovorax odorimutans]
MDKNAFYETSRMLCCQGYGRSIVETLLSYTSSPIGFRLGGTEAEHKTSKFIADELKEAGLKNIKLEEIPVDAFELKGARIRIDGSPGSDGKRIPKRLLTASQFAGFQGTAGEIRAQAVYVGRGFKDDYEAISKEPDFFKDKIVVLDGSFDTVWVGWQSAEATVRGAVAAIYTTCPENKEGTYLTYAPDMLIGADGENNFEDIPAVFISRQDGAWLKDQLKDSPETSIALESKVQVTLAKEGGIGYNVIAEIPGKRSDKVILLAAHQDAHLKSAADDTGAAATVMTIAKAMIMSGYEPEATIRLLFTSSEEYGKINTVYDWQHGAVEAMIAHPEWRDETVIVLNYEVMPEKGAVTMFRGVPEVMTLVEKCAEGMKGEHYPAVVRTLEMLISIADEWTFCAHGIPCLSVTSMREDYLGRYHTNYDCVENLDYKAMGQIANASFDLITAFDEGLIDFSLERRVADFDAWYSDPATSSLEKEVQMGMSKEEFEKIDVEPLLVEKVDQALTTWTASVEKFNTAKGDMANITEANHKLIQYNKHVLSSCIASSVGQNTIYPYMQTQSDAAALKMAIEELDKDRPEKETVLAALDKVNLDLFGWVPLTKFINWFSLETCRRMFELYKPMEGTWGYYGKLSPMPDIYEEYIEVRDSQSPDYKKIKAAMIEHYQFLTKELALRLDKTAEDMKKAAKLLDDIR